MVIEKSQFADPWGPMTPEQERRLRLSEQRLLGILTIAADAILSIDDTGVITMFNHGAEVIFGYKADEVIGQSLETLLPVRYRAAHGGHIQRFAHGTEPARRMGERQEIFGLRKDGTEFPAEASISKIEVDSRMVFTAVLRDITERKRHQYELEARVAERTSALQDEIRQREKAQAALIQSQRMDVLGQLTGGIAHDSNNLLTVITGNLELLEDELGEHPGLKYLRQAQEAALMGARLNQRLRTFSRRRRLAAEVINLNNEVLGMSELLRRTLGETVKLTTILMHDLWPTLADPSEVENAILNLALNARDAMPKGGDLRIETQNAVIEPEVAKLEKELAAGEYVRLSVSDTGTGIPPDSIRRVFEPFFSTKGPGKGTGLGLSTIYGFVKQSNGHVTIYSELGLGTTVNLYLPRVADPKAPAISPRSAHPLDRSRGETILVVEDNPQVRALTIERLQRLGYRVLEAEDGPEALEKFVTGNRIDLVFSDVVMPGGLSGFDLAHAIRQRDQNARVLLTSGFSEGAARDVGLELDKEKVLRKPYSLAELAEAIRRAIDG